MRTYSIFILAFVGFSCSGNAVVTAYGLSSPYISAMVDNVINVKHSKEYNMKMWKSFILNHRMLFA